MKLLQEFFWYFQDCPHNLVHRGNIKELKKRLDLGLSPDHNDSIGTPLLYHAIELKKPEITVLLLQYGASPNKLLLTYGLNYKHAEQSWGSRNSTISWLNANKEQCYQLYFFLKKANIWFAEKKWDLAQDAFSKAEKILEIFIEDEKKFLREKIHDSDPAYLNDYERRRRECEEKIKICKDHLATACDFDSEDDIERSESAPLLGHDREFSDSGPRRRTAQF